MKMKNVFALLVLFLGMGNLMTQEMPEEMPEEMKLPYEQIPEAPDSYEAHNIMSRMVDGLGFRYYWATKDLRPEDLLFTPGNDGRNCEETLEHILNLSTVILNTSMNNATGSLDWSELAWEGKRAITLNNLKAASDRFRSLEAKDLKDLQVKFDRNNKQSEFPFWNLLNGPLADAIYHTGQIVSYRRSAGNPQPSGVNVFRGTHTHQH